MKSFKPFIWGTAVVVVGLLNIAEVLPDWTTVAAILTLPFVATAAGMRCGRGKEA